MNLTPGLTISSLVSSLVFPVLLSAEIYTDGNFIIDCQQSVSSEILDCRYRQTETGYETELSVTAGETELQFQDKLKYPENPGTSAVLFLVDTSDPARQDVIDNNINQVKSLVNARQAHQSFGLARFDKDINVLADLGSTNEQIISAAGKLEATGKTTELYRNLIKAINLLNDFDADRKSIFLFSDGLAEDKAYFNKDVVNAAGKYGVYIYSMGFPRSVPQSVSLQTIRRISEETGGLYIESDNQFKLPDAFISDPFKSLENGGHISIDLSPVLNATDPKNQIEIKINSGGTESVFPVQIKQPKATGVSTRIIEKEVPVIVEKPVQAAKQPVQVVRVPVESTEKRYDKWLWYGIPALLFVLLFLTVATFFLLIKRPDSKKDKDSFASNDFKPFAYLVLQEESQKRYPITRETWRIGRSRDNELILEDNSVSRKHAEIHRDQGDDFTIIDLGALNGVFVNGEKIKKQKLKEGDMIEIGDVYLRFTLLSSEYQIEESTVLQNTKAPLTH